MDRSDASALADLQMHWDEAYAIGLDGDIWSARFHGATDELRAHTAGELRELIRTDYWYRQRVSSTAGASARTGAASTSTAPTSTAPTSTAPTSTADDTAGVSYEDAAEGAGSDSSDDTVDGRVHDTDGIRGAEALSRADFAAIRGERMSI